MIMKLKKTGRSEGKRECVKNQAMNKYNKSIFKKRGVVPFHGRTITLEKKKTTIHLF